MPTHFRATNEPPFSSKPLDSQASTILLMSNSRGGAIMGFKSKVRKRRGNTGNGTSEDGDSEEYEGQIRCGIIECGNWADKKIGGRKMAYDRAVEVWGASGVSRKVRKVSLCKPCYRTWKKEKKGEPKEWVSKGKGPLGNAPPTSTPVRSFDQP